MARQTEAEWSGRLPYGCMSQSMPAMIAAIGVPSPEVALAGAQTGLISCDEHGDWHWRTDKIEAMPEVDQAELLYGLREMVGYQ